MAKDVMMEKLGPCLGCGDYKKPCRCSLETRIKKLESTLELIKDVLERGVCDEVTARINCSSRLIKNISEVLTA
jgi:hypothetical protein